MDIFFHSLFAGIQITLGILSLFIYMKKDTQKLYLYFGIFSFFSGLYFALISMSRIIEVDLYKAIISCAAIYYGIFPWFIYEFIERKTNVVLWVLSSVFGIAWFLFVAEIGNGQVELWQIMAHIGLIGLMAVAIFASRRMIVRHQRGVNEFIILTLLFIFLGLEEIFTSHTEYKILTNYISGKK